MNSTLSLKALFLFLQIQQDKKMSNITYVTKETLDQMILELNHLKGHGRS